MASQELCTVYQLGRMPYGEAYRLQNELVLARINGSIRDTLLLLEHPPTITIGKKGSMANVRVSREELEKKGISVFFTERGGDVTYHGPAQLVGYPIISLEKRGKDIFRYIHDLEESLIRTLNDFGIRSGRDASHRGVWVEKKEIAAIGLRLQRWVTMHGFALNVNTDLEPFSLINPCGFTDRGATSISVLLGSDVAMATVIERFLERFAEVFNLRLRSGDNLVGGIGDESQAAGVV